MMRRSLICVLLTAMLLLFFAGCGTKGEDTTQTNVQLLIQKLGLSENRANGACEKMEEAGIPCLKKAGWVCKQKGTLASVTDENRETYLLTFSELGFLESIVRESDQQYLYFQIE